jgi:hypothetical protein
MPSGRAEVGEPPPVKLLALGNPLTPLTNFEELPQRDKRPEISSPANGGRRICRAARASIRRVSLPPAPLPNASNPTGRSFADGTPVRRDVRPERSSLHGQPLEQGGSAMTSDYYDSEALRRILRDLNSDDPEFVRSFEADASPPPSAPDEQPDSSLVWILVFINALILSLLSLTMGSFGIGMLFAAVAWFGASRWFHSYDNEPEQGLERP